MNPNANTRCESCNAPHRAMCICDVPLEELLSTSDPSAGALEAEYMADCAAGDVEPELEPDYAELVSDVDPLHRLREACVPPDVDAVAVLPTGSHVPSFADRCRAARVTVYAEQRRRNERFEHLRRLLTVPMRDVEHPASVPAASPVATLRASVNAELRRESRSTVRCTCCHEHSSPIFKHDDRPDEPVHTYLRNGWALRDCPDCIRNFYADAKAAEVGERVKGQCRAELHVWSVEQPDSSTVKTEEEAKAEQAYDLGPVSAADLYEVDADKPKLRPVDAILSSTKTLDEDLVDEPVFDKRPVGAITANLKTNWVTYTSSQAKARVTLNTTSRRIKIRYGRLDIYQEHLKGLSDAQLLARRDGLAAWCTRWLRVRGIEPNVAVATTQEVSDPVRATRRLRDRLAEQDVETNVRFIR